MDIKEWMANNALVRVDCRAHASSKLIKASDTPWIILQRYIHTSISQNINNNRYSLQSISPKLNQPHQNVSLNEYSEFLFFLLFNVTKWIN